MGRINSLLAHVEFHRNGSRPIALRIYQVTDPRFPIELWDSHHFHPLSFGSKQKAVARWCEECRRLADEGWRLKIDQIADDDFMVFESQKPVAIGRARGSHLA